MEKKQEKGEAGFTLLELILSISILGIMIVILMGALRLGFRSVEAGEKKMESLERIKASFQVIDSQIQSEVPLTYDENGETRPCFKGSPDSLEFSSNYSIWQGEAGYVVVSYRVSEGGPGKLSLWASEKKVGQEKERELKLFDQMDELGFEYFSQDPTEEKGKWVDEWTEPTLRPEKIKVHLLKGGKPLSLIVPLKTGRILGADVVQTVAPVPKK